MFKQRLLTSLCLIPLVLLAIYYANGLIFTILFSIMALVCAFEWLSLIPLQKRPQQLVFMLIIAAALVISHFIFSFILYAGLAVWLLITLLVVAYPRFASAWGKPLIVAAAAIVVLPLFYQSLLHIVRMPQGRMLLLYLLFLVWAADIGAYFAGKQWGKHKLIPKVSPGKTVEGLMGGLVLCLGISIPFNIYLHLTDWSHWLIYAALIMLISLVGDLFISMLKRRVGLKDTGNILPGHGGILDRLDSLIAASPLFYILIGSLFSG